MKKYIYIFVLFYSLLTCQGKQDNYIPIEEISASEVDLIPDKNTKTVQTILTFKKLETIDYLSVKKSGGELYSVNIKNSELSSPFTFSYNIKKTDPESFKLVLQAHYKNGNTSKETYLNIDNRWGFFVRKISRIARVTGTSMAGESIPNPNNTTVNWNVGGTDLGIIWEIQPGKYGIFFGDTFGSDFKPNPVNSGGNGSNWRSNVLAYSEDLNLDDGLTFSKMATDSRGDAREIIYSAKDVSGNGDWTSIPTGAIRANNTDYVHYFNIKNWFGWTTNYSGLYKSLDNGENWEKCNNILFASNSYFGMCGYFKKDGYVYMIGTPAGRSGYPRLARFAESDIENRNNYEYWSGHSRGWMKGNETEAVILINHKAGELSFIYNETLKKWIIAYINEDYNRKDINNIVIRYADEITGPWSEPFIYKEYELSYGSFFHPLSISGENLYFLMSIWYPYNVFLMKVEIGDMGEFE